MQFSHRLTAIDGKSAVFPMCSLHVGALLVCLHLKGVRDHDRNEPHGGTDTPGRSWGPPSMQSAGCVDDSEVSIYTDAERKGGKIIVGRGSFIKNGE